MANKRFTELVSEATTVKNDHYIAVDHGTDGTQKMSLQTLFSDVKGDLNESLNLVLSLRNATSNTRFMAIPYDFENGKSYIVKLFSSDTTVSYIRIASAANLNTDSIVQGFTVNDTKAEVEYKCASSIAKYLIVICPSNVTQFTFTISLYEGGIFDDVYTLKNDVDTIKRTYEKIYVTPTYVDNSYVDRDGSFKEYNGWSRTDFIDVSRYTNLLVNVNNSGGTYIYNAFFSDDDTSTFISNFTVISGANDIVIPDGAKYAVFSNSSNMLKTIYEIGGYISAYELRNITPGQEGEIPSYSVDYLDTKTKSIMNQIMNGKSNNEAFAFITDTHFPSNSGESGKYMGYLLGNLPMSKAFFGGDVCPAYSSAYSGATSEQACTRSIVEQFEAINKKLASFDLFQCKGNHDFHVSSQTDSTDKFMMNPQQDRNVIMGGSKLCEIVTDNSNPTACYYYIDNPSQNIRYVVMDACEFFGTGNEWVQTYGMSDNQINWIVNTAIKTALDRSFIFITHCGLVDMTCSNNLYATFTRIENIIRALNGHRTYTASGVTYDFTGATGKVLAVITGHEHQDLMTFTEGIPHVSVACDAMYGDYKKSFIYTHFNSVPPTKVAGTVEEVTFDIVNVDDESIKFNRIGGGGDRYFNLDSKTVSVGNTITITPTILGTIEWWCYDSTGRSVDANYVITPSTTKATVSNGVVSGLIVGEAVVVAKNENNEYEFFDVIVQ